FGSRSSCAFGSRVSVRGVRNVRSVACACRSQSSYSGIAADRLATVSSDLVVSPELGQAPFVPPAGVAVSLGTQLFVELAHVLHQPVMAVVFPHVFASPSCHLTSKGRVGDQHRHRAAKGSDVTVSDENSALAHRDVAIVAN